MATTKSRIPIRKLAIVLLILILSNFFGGSLLAVYYNQVFLWILALPIALSLWLVSLRCPRCRKPIYKKVKVVFGVTFTYWGGFNPIPDKCDRCQFDFGKIYQSKDAISVGSNKNLEQRG